MRRIYRVYSLTIAQGARMSETQHTRAKELLAIIARVGAHSGKLTYRSAAETMGMSDYEKQSRPVAHICNLLDAAACLAGVPLLAMVAVRDINGEINPKAWEKEYGAARLAILDRSRSHSFSDADFDAIDRALSDLKPLGDQAAWKLVDRTYGDLQYRRLIGDYSDPLYDALNDLRDGRSSQSPVHRLLLSPRPAGPIRSVAKSRRKMRILWREGLP